MIGVARHVSDHCLPASRRCCTLGVFCRGRGNNGCNGAGGTFPPSGQVGRWDADGGATDSHLTRGRTARRRIRRALARVSANPFISTSLMGSTSPLGCSRSRQSFRFSDTRATGSGRKGDLCARRNRERRTRAGTKRSPCDPAGRNALRRPSIRAQDGARGVQPAFGRERGRAARSRCVARRGDAERETGGRR